MVTARPVFALNASEKAALARVLAHAARRGDALPGVLRLAAAADLQSGTWRRHCELVADALDAGEPLSAALGRLPRSFTRDDVALVAAGEAAGSPAEALEGWEALAGRRARLARAFRSSLAWPLSIVLVACWVIGIYVSEVAPTFVAISAPQGIALPAAHSVIVVVARFQARAWPIEMIAAIALVLAWRRAEHAGATWPGRVTLALPLAASVSRSHARSVTLGIIAAFVRAGRGLPEALHHAAAAQRNGVLARELEQAAQRAEAGEPIDSVFESVSALDRATVHSLRAALASRDPAAAVDALAQREQMSFDRRCRRIDALLPSVAVLVAGVFVGLILGAIYPMLLGSCRLVP
jgi:type II secretory pathway component PulF